MRLELRAALAEATDGEIKLDIGAVVARGMPAKGVVLELGPADGSPHLRLYLSGTEALRLGATLQGIANGGGEEILIVSE